MSPRSLKQYQELKRKKSSLIIKTALLRFSQDGYKSSSMLSIAKEANVSKGNLYNYFESKEALLESVLIFGMEQFADQYAEIGSSIDSEEKFADVIFTNFKLIKTNKSFWKLYYNLVSQPTAQTHFAEIIEPFIKQFMQLFEAYFERKGEKDPYTSALLLGGAMDGISLDYLLMGETYPLDNVVNKLIEKFK